MARTARFPLPDPHTTALQLGAVRTLVAVSILAAPVMSARALGADTASARRVTWLTRMMGVRDGAIGVGALAAERSGGASAPWLLAGAVSDAVDAAVLAGAIAQGRVKGLLPRLVVLGASAAAVAGAVSAARVRR